MKKIMFFMPLLYIGGTEIAILNLIKNLHGFDIYIGYMNGDCSEMMMNKLSKYARLVNIKKEKNLEVDYFVSCSMRLHIYDEINEIKRNKTILWVHHTYNVLDGVLNSDYCNKIDAIVTVSDTLANELKSTFNNLSSKIMTIYNIIDNNEIIKKSQENFDLELSKQLNLVTVARVCKNKGFNRMLTLARYLKISNIDFKWFIIGDNYSKDEAKEIKESFNEFKENFVWFGFLDNPYKIVRQCDYNVLLSDSESWGLVITEAMILGVPSIATDFEVSREQIEDKKNGIILSLSNIESYKSRIDEIVNFKSKYKKSVNDFKYDNSNIIKKWEELLDSCIISN